MVTRGGTTPRVAAIVQPLVSAKITTKQALLAKWCVLQSLVVLMLQGILIRHS